MLKKELIWNLKNLDNLENLEPETRKAFLEEKARIERLKVKVNLF